MDFTKKIIDFISTIYKNNGHKVRKNTQKLDVISYYMMIGDLKREGIVVQDGIEDGQKVWKLTPRGLKVAKLLIDLTKEVDEIFEGTRETKEED